MPVAILTIAIDYKNRTMFPERKDNKIVKGERVSVTEEQAEHLFSTGLFEIIEDDEPPVRSRRDKTRVSPEI